MGEYPSDSSLLISLLEDKELENDELKEKVAMLERKLSDIRTIIKKYVSDNDVTA